MVGSKPLCVYCKQPLVAIGAARRGGAAHRDWGGSQFHKQCFKKLHPPKPRKTGGRAVGKRKWAGKKGRCR